MRALSGASPHHIRQTAYEARRIIALDSNMVKKKQKKNLSYRDISYRQKETIQTGGEMNKLPTEIDEIMKEYGNQFLVDDEDLTLKQTSTQAVNNLISPVLEAEPKQLEQVSRTAKILQ